jgi:hypothetical protein
MSDLKLRRCSPAARGVWVDIMCALHDSDDSYGLMRWPLKEIATTVGASMAHVRELVEKGVLRGSDSELTQPLVYQARTGRKLGPAVTLVPSQPGPVWFSKRMVIDEHVRTIRGDASKFGAPEGAAPKAPPTGAPKPPFGDGSSTSSPSPASLKEIEDPPDRAGAGPDLAEIVGDAKPTRAGELCRLMKAEGIQATNPGHPDLLALIAAGVTDDEVRGAARGANGKGDPFAYALAALTKQRQRAAAVQLHAGPLPPTETAYQRSQRERMQQVVPNIAAKAPGAINPNPMEVLDGLIKRIG